MNSLGKFATGLVLLGLLVPIGQAAAPSEKVVIEVRPIDLKEAAKVSYSRDIQPILANSCDECHSAEEHKSGFDISSVTALKKRGKKAGPGVIPGQPDQSSVVEYIRGLAKGPQMPKGETVLSADELHLIRSWIAAGAVDDSASFAAVNKKKSSSSSVAAPASQELVSAFLFGTWEDQFAARRRARLAQIPRPPEPPAVAGLVNNPIDQFILAKWAAAKLPEATSPPPVCDDATFIRRVCLDVTGVIPPAASTRQFVADQTWDKRLRLVDELLARDQDYAEDWTPFWEDALASEPTMGGVATHGDYRDFIYQSFLANKPYDLMVAELLDPTLPDHKPSTIAMSNGKTNVLNFIRNETPMDTIQSAANTAQVFLGTGMKCASCHSHFLNKEWPQKRFTAFAGLFGTEDLELVRCEKHSGQFVPAAFPFDIPGAPATAPTNYDERLHYATTLLIDPFNPRFAKTIVNRLWKRYLGLGLFEPVDDFRLDRPPSHPELLDWLADDFMRHDYDLKHTIRLILTSRTYQLQYNPALEDNFNVQNPGAPRYARSPALRRLTAEQIIDSLRQAVALHWDDDRLFRTNTSTALMRALGRAPVRTEISTGRSEDVAVVQSLELLNGTELHHYIYDGEILTELASETDRQKVIGQIYWTVLSRPPTAEEMKLGLDYLKTDGPPKEPLGDMLWALVVSPEFQYIR